MRAIRIHAPGDTSKLGFEDVQLASPAAGEVRIKLEAAGLNYIDIYHRTGLYPVQLPYTLGLDGAGKILEVGKDIKTFKVGDRVAFANVPGAYAEEIIAPVKALVKIPDNVPTEIAAAIMLQGMTAHYLATSTFVLGPGKNCLIHAAAGGVGL